MAQLAEQSLNHPGLPSDNDQCPYSLVLNQLTEHTHSCKMFEFQKAFYVRTGQGPHYHFDKSEFLCTRTCASPEGLSAIHLLFVPMVISLIQGEGTKGHKHYLVTGAPLGS